MPAVPIEETTFNYTPSSSIGSSTIALEATTVLSFPIPLSATPAALQSVWYDQPQSLEFDFMDEGDDNFGSPLPFDASENGLWNGKFVPPPPRPPFLEDSIAADGVTTCDLCSWAMPTKSTFIFDGTIEKATEFGWPLTLIIVSIVSAILGAIIMVTVVRCKRKKSTSRNGKCSNQHDIPRQLSFNPS